MHVNSPKLFDFKLKTSVVLDRDTKKEIQCTKLIKKETIQNLWLYKENIESREKKRILSREEIQKESDIAYTRCEGKTRKNEERNR